MKRTAIPAILMFGGLTLVLALVACGGESIKQTEFKPEIPLGSDETLIYIPP